MPAVRTAIFGCSSRGSVGAYYSAARFAIIERTRKQECHLASRPARHRGPSNALAQRLAAAVDLVLCTVKNSHLALSGSRTSERQNKHGALDPESGPAMPMSEQTKCVTLHHGHEALPPGGGGPAERAATGRRAAAVPRVAGYVRSRLGYRRGTRKTPGGVNLSTGVRRRKLRNAR